MVLCTGPVPNIRAEGKPEFKHKLRVQMFSTTQVEDRKKKGLCFHCDEKWQPGHNCKTPPKLYIMESFLLNSDSKPTCQDLSDPKTIKATPEPQISDSLFDVVVEITLYALVGTPASGTMRLKGKINGHWVIILIDTGSEGFFLVLGHVLSARGVALIGLSYVWELHPELNIGPSGLMATGILLSLQWLNKYIIK